MVDFRFIFELFMVYGLPVVNLSLLISLLIRQSKLSNRVQKLESKENRCSSHQSNFSDVFNEILNFLHLVEKYEIELNQL